MTCLRRWRPPGSCGSAVSRGRWDCVEEKQKKKREFYITYQKYVGMINDNSANNSTVPKECFSVNPSYKIEYLVPFETPTHIERKKNK